MTCVAVPQVVDGSISEGMTVASAATGSAWEVGPLAGSYIGLHYDSCSHP
jgi:hypothetical protein